MPIASPPRKVRQTSEIELPGPDCSYSVDILFGMISPNCHKSLEASNSSGTIVGFFDNNDGVFQGFIGNLDSGMVGDMDCDGDIDFDDIDDFVLGLQDPQAYEDLRGIPPTVKGDTDGDGDLDFDDITGFVELLSGSP